MTRGFRKPMPSQDVLKSMFIYEPETGVLVWKNPERKRSPTFGFTSEEGYILGTIDRVQYFAHRLIWKLTYGEDPDCVDHINGDRADNRLENLRNVNSLVNARNRIRHKNNATGTMGVVFEPNKGQWKRELPGKWRARIGVEGKKLCLGEFITKQEAEAARQAAERVLNFTVRYEL